MNLLQPELTDLIRSCAAEKTDVYLSLRALPRAEELEAFGNALGTPVLVLLPGAVFGVPQGRYQLIAAESALPQKIRPGAVFADVRAAAAEGFAGFLQRHRIREWAVPFYECASPAEYGYRLSCAVPAELRASLPFPVHITAFTRGDRLRPECFAAMGTDEYAFFGEQFTDALTGAKTENEAEALRLTASQCRKHPWKKTAVFCTTRAKAETLYAYLRRSGARAALLHGGRTPAQAQDAINAYTAGEAQILVATKAALPSYLFIKADRAYYFGLPYSLSHAARCAAFTDGGEITCIYSADDVLLNRRLTGEFCRSFAPDAERTLALRLSMQEELLAAL